MSDSFDRDNPGVEFENPKIDISPFGVVEFDAEGRVRRPDEHADFLAWIEERLAEVPVGFAGFVVTNNGRVLHFDSLGCLMMVCLEGDCRC